MHRSLPLLIGLTFCSGVHIANAHHGFAAHFHPDRVIRIEGTVKQFDFINPHGILHIDSVDESGEPVVYVCDLQARSQLIRHGVDESLFTVGELIVVVGFAARRDPLRCEFGTGYFEDGSSFTMRSTEGARSQFAENHPAPLAAGTSRTILGNWIRPGMYGDANGRGRRTGQDSITAEGQAAVDAFDAVTQNPLLDCRGGSPVRNWGPPGLATTVRRENGKIVIYHESMDVTRVVHLDLDEHAADIESSEMGHSIGRFVDDELIIHTAAFTNGVLIGSTLHTDQMTLEERLSVQEDSGKLLIAWTVYDPAYYAKPLTGSQLLHSTDKEIMRYDCVPGSPGE